MMCTKLMFSIMMSEELYEEIKPILMCKEPLIIKVPIQTGIPEAYSMKLEFFRGQQPVNIHQTIEWLVESKCFREDE